MPLRPLEQAYQQVILALAATYENHTTFNMKIDTYLQSPWLGYWDSPNPLNEILPTDKSIVEVVVVNENLLTPNHCDWVNNCK